MTVLLSVQGVSKSFGSVKVTNDLSFDLQRGETLGILGPNGAGKTTLFNLISGDLASDSGRILLNGQDITRLPAYQRCAAGIGRSYQVAQPFGGMTVFENLVVAAMFGAGQARRQAHHSSVEILRRTALLPKANRLAGALTLLDRKRLELARALATRPEVLLLDEIAGGLTEKEAGQLVEMIEEIRGEGISIVWIEHVIHALVAVATRLLVIDFGSKLAEGPPREVMQSPDVQRIYMGVEAQHA